MLIHIFIAICIVWSLVVWTRWAGELFITLPKNAEYNEMDGVMWGSGMITSVIVITFFLNYFGV